MEYDLIGFFYDNKPEMLDVWNSFVKQSGVAELYKWTERHVLGHFEVSNESSLEVTTTVRVIKEDGLSAAIYSADLDRLVEVTLPSDDYFSGHINGTMTPGGELKLISFGPVGRP